jgi:hypothetical protein
MLLMHLPFPRVRPHRSKASSEFDERERGILLFKVEMATTVADIVVGDFLNVGWRNGNPNNSARVNHSPPGSSRRTTVPIK